MKNFKKGFTLIELLVVVAIIGILASVVLSSLNAARSKGIDAAIKADLTNMRAQAALYYSDNNTYGSDVTCQVTSDAFTGCDGLFLDGQMRAAMKAAATISGVAVDSSTDSTGEMWAASATLKSSGETFCVDSAGFTKNNSTVSAGICN